jgi:hypothetical protein
MTQVVAQELSYAEAATACGGQLPDYIPKDSAPRIVTIVRVLALPSNRGSDSFPCESFCSCRGRPFSDVDVWMCFVGARLRERVVAWASQGADAGCPCGGTHVGDVAEIQGMRITGVRVKKGTTRVSYVVD